MKSAKAVDLRIGLTARSTGVAEKKSTSTIVQSVKTSHVPP
jgi:hypothetical protein